jgi:hypothetical protein
MTTFVIPAEVFPTRAKATCHGISAASGKIGAAVGAALINPLLEWYVPIVKSIIFLDCVCRYGDDADAKTRGVELIM